MITPRSYQLEAVSSVRGAYRSGDNTALIKLPTGAGKSMTAAELIDQMLDVVRTYRALVVVPRASIIDSFVSAIESQTGIRPTIAASSSHGCDISGQIVVGMWQTLHRRILPHFDLVIADEAHRINQDLPDSGYYSVVRTALVTGSKVLGLTATPFRQRGYIYGAGKLFPSLTYAKDLKWTTDEGFTVRARLSAPLDGAVAFDTNYLEVGPDGDYTAASVDSLVLDHPRMVAQVRDIISRSAGRRKVAIACANIIHAKAVARELERRGHRAETVVSTDVTNARRLALGRFETEEACRFLTFVSIVAEGYDYPPTDCIVFLRPTRSSVFYIQCVGRGLRPAEGKSDCLVLDYGQVVKNCGPLDAPIVVRGTGRQAQLQELAALPFDIVQCKDCGAFLFPDKNRPGG
jgi:DNA repair protein RadD